MSAPAINVRPSQISTIALTLSSAIAASIPSTIPVRTWWLSAFTGGLLTVMTATAPWFSIDTDSVSAAMLAPYSAGGARFGAAPYKLVRCTNLRPGHADQRIWASEFREPPCSFEATESSDDHETVTVSRSHKHCVAVPQVGSGSRLNKDAQIHATQSLV